jgi:uncharacterized protein YbbC (DUF1343 family)
MYNSGPNLGCASMIRGLALFSVLVLISLPASVPSNGADKTPGVLNGIDVLRQQDFEPLSGKHIGLITNQTGLASDGTPTIDLLFRSKVCKLVALFSPEHGIRGNMDSKIASSVDEATSLPIYSLYGDTRCPTTEMLKGIDALVFDIQDIGTRFYTYVSTMAYCMEASAKAGISFYVLDRPNPIGGIRVEGPMLDPDRTSFTGFMPLPVRHGMTVGELARFFKSESKMDVQLHVIAMKGWHRSFYFWDTGQLWVDPSPNMRNMLEAILYPGVCLLEDAKVSVGRGTDRPFELVGAPWIEPRRLAAALQSAHLAGVRFVPVFFTPTSSNYHGVRCGGVNILITDSGRLNSVLLGLTLISVLHKLYPEESEIQNVIDLLGNKAAMKNLKAGKPPAEVLRLDGPELRKFLVKRQNALIYDTVSRRKGGDDGSGSPKEKKKR